MERKNSRSTFIVLGVILILSGVGTQVFKDYMHGRLSLLPLLIPAVFGIMTLIGFLIYQKNRSM